MKVRPVILCGGAGTRLWHNSKNHQPKQFINFGNWTLFGKTLERIKNNTLFDYPIISTNFKYIKDIKIHLKKHNIKKFKLILEPEKNTAPAILTSTLMTIEDNNFDKPLLFLSADHFIENNKVFTKKLKRICQI